MKKLKNVRINKFLFYIPIIGLLYLGYIIIANKGDTCVLENVDEIDAVFFIVSNIVVLLSIWFIPIIKILPL